MQTRLIDFFINHIFQCNKLLLRNSYLQRVILFQLLNHLASSIFGIIIWQFVHLRKNSLHFILKASFDRFEGSFWGIFWDLISKVNV